jgi:hypothetical protein
LAKARESRGRGSAQATIESTLVPQNGGTRVDIVTELALSGSVAQYGRGVIPSVAAQLTQSFADCLRAQLAAAPAEDGAEAAPQPPPQTAPVHGIRLGLRALLHLITKPFRRHS